MCDPLTIAGIALTAGSTIAGQVAQSKVANARDDVLAAERVRQRGLDQEAAALNTQSQDRYQNAEGQQQEKAKELGDYFKGQQIEADTAAAAGVPAMPVSDSNITVQAENKERGEARAFTDRLGEARGDMRSFGDYLAGVGRLQARDAGKIGQIGGFKKGSSGVTALELDAANGAGNGIKMFGDLAGVLGGAAIGKGLQGTFAGAGNVASKAGSMAAGRVADRLSVPGYSAAGGGGISNLFGIFG
jgi:hypothetical protein